MALDKLTISQAFSMYRYDYIAMKNQSAKTEENHIICGRALVKYFNDIPVNELTFHMVRDWKMELSKKRSQATVRNYIIKLRVVLAFLKKHGYDCLDPETIPIPQRADTIAQYVTSDEVARMLKVTRRARSRAIISLLYGAGIRLSELISLDKSQIIEDSFSIVGKGGKARLCFIDERTHDLLAEYLETRSDNHAALFVSTQKPIGRMTATNIQLIVKTAALKAGIDRHVTPHTLRHAFATNFGRNNGNVRHLQVLMGHSSLETTAKYMHVVNEDLRKAYLSAHTT